MSKTYGKFALILLLLGACSKTPKETPKAEAPGANERSELSPNLPTDELAGEGLLMEIHGAVHEFRQYVGTIRKKDNFFVAEQFPLLPANASIAREFAKLKRHDKVRVKGELVNPDNPQRHIRVSSLEIVASHESELPPHDYDIKVPDELGSQGKIQALVHAIAGEGRVLLIDYRGVVLPVMVSKPELTKDLYRSDSIELSYRYTKNPNRPPHLRLDHSEKVPVKVLYSIVAEHEKDGERVGELVLFPKSPQVMFNIFALEFENALGLKHNYTLVNFSDSSEFKRIREKLQKAWDEAPQDQVFNARNRLQNPRIIVKARGKFNVQDQGQANPQILLESADDLEIEVR